MLKAKAGAASWLGDLNFQNKFRLGWSVFLNVWKVSNIQILQCVRNHQLIEKILKKLRANPSYAEKRAWIF